MGYSDNVDTSGGGGAGPAGATGATGARGVPGQDGDDADSIWYPPPGALLGAANAWNTEQAFYGSLTVKGGKTLEFEQIGNGLLRLGSGEYFGNPAITFHEQYLYRQDSASLAFTKGLNIQRHAAVGNGTVIDGEVLSGYTPGQVVLFAKETFTDTSATSLLDTALGARVLYRPTAAFGGGEYAPSIYGVSMTAQYDAQVGTDGVNNNDLVGIAGDARVLATALMPPYILYGAEIGATLASGAPAMSTDIAGGHFGVTMLGALPAVPSTADIAAMKLYRNSGRTGAYTLHGLLVKAQSGVGVPANSYGVYIEANTVGSSKAYNLYSAGVTSKNLFEGDVIARNLTGRVNDLARTYPVMEAQEEYDYPWPTGGGAAAAASATPSSAYATSIGDGAAQSFNVDHALGSLDVQVQIYRNSTGAQIEADITRSTVNRVVVGFVTTPSLNEYRVVVR